MSQLNHRTFRSVYLLTYSQADIQLVPTREEFSHLVIRSIETATPAKMIHWVCSKETHADGGKHYHMAVKLDRQQRWLAIRDHLHIVEGIPVNFTDDHSNYYDAWRYVTKEDLEPLSSTDHPDLTNAPPPRTGAALRARRNGEAHQDEPPAKKSKRLRVLDIASIITSKNIRTYLQLMALSKVQKDEGKLDLYEYILIKGLLWSLFKQKNCQ